MNRRLHPQPDRQHGIAAVEFALTCVVLFSFLFGIVEVARMSFLWNSLTQATSVAARGAAMSPFSSSTALATVLQNAIFTSSAAETMPMTDNIHYDNLVVEYLDASRKPVTALPSCQIDNLTNCANDPTGNSCVRFVRVRLCQSGGAGCAHVPYHPMIPLPAMAGLNIDLPWFTAIVPLEAQTTPGKCN
jgi:hypothetical protein